MSNYAQWHDASVGQFACQNTDVHIHCGYRERLKTAEGPVVF